MKKFTVCILVLATLIFALCSCGTSGENTKSTSPAVSAGTVQITDMLGRMVSVPSEVKRPVCIGAGCLRLYSYIGDMSILAGVENCDKGVLFTARPYQYANNELFNSLPTIGAGGSQGSPEAEAIVSVNPDVIFAIYNSMEAAEFDELQQKTGVPVVVLSYGQTEAFDDAINDSLTIMGTVLGKTERTEEVKKYIADIKEDLDTRTKDIKDEDKKSVYIGCLNKKGTHGIESSSADYSLFDAVHAKNVLDEAGYSGYQSSIDTETLITLNPDVIILDAGGLENFKTQYDENKKVYDSITAFKNGEVYVQMPYNAYYTNLEIAYADAYFIGKTLHPETFSDIDINAKLKEITEFLLGTDCTQYVYELTGREYGKLELANF
jgi:iron complex transport system substrate-binding protein